MRQWRRIAVHGLCRVDGRVLLVRVAGDARGSWQLPGGVVGHGEHPTDALRRALAGVTGLTVASPRPRAAVADVRPLDSWRVDLHTDRLVYDVGLGPGRAGPGPAAWPTGDGGGVEVAWLAADDLTRAPLAPFTAELLGVPVTPVPKASTAAAPTADPGPPADSEAPPQDPGASNQHPPPGVVDALPPVPPRADRRQRFAAYGLVTDPYGRVLLTLIADGYPGAGRWHLPGGGTDHGEQPQIAMLRELVEESGQLGRVDSVLDVSHTHDAAALGPEGHPIDWHAVRVVYRVVVRSPTVPAVTELAGGSTAAAAWWDVPRVRSVDLTEVAAAALAGLTSAEAAPPRP